MLQRRFTPGAAVPAGGFDTKRAIDDAKVKPRTDPLKVQLEPFRTSFRLDDMLGGAVRDQGGRGTCNAFAVVAAEEIYQNAHGDGGADYSEEYLYAGMRAAPLPDHAAGSAAAIAADGSTFLEQARTALARTGLVPRDQMPYRDDPNLPVNHFEAMPPDLAAAAARVPESAFVHDVDISHASGAQEPRTWREGTQGPLSQEFADVLAKGIPVVAAFSILGLPGDAAWYAHRARLHGEVRYPSDEVAAEMPVRGGHSVCLVGTLPGRTPDEDVFVMRNSFGTQAFGGSPKIKARYPRAPARGYGIIKAAAVDRYCWEFLYRVPKD